MNGGGPRGGERRALYALAALVRRTGRLLVATRAAAGLGWTVAWAAGSLAAAAALDSALPLPEAARVAAWLAVVFPAALLLALDVLLPLVRPPSPNRVARVVERALGRMHNRLLSCLDLLRPGAADTVSARFRERLIAETTARVAVFRPWHVADRVALRRAGTAAVAALLALAALRVLAPERGPVALARILHPLADIPPVGAAAYRVDPGTTAMLRGDDLMIAATVTRGRPDRLRLRLRDAAGRALEYPLEAGSNGVWRFTLTGFERGFTYRVEGGGTWSPRYRVTLLDRPALLSLQTVLHYPAGMVGLPPLTNAPQVADVRGPRGSRVEVRAAVGGDTVSGVVRVWRGAAGATNRALAAACPLARSTNGLWTGAFALDADGAYALEFCDRFGHPGKPMRPGELAALVDAPPQVAIERPGADLVLGQPVAIPLVVSASDDYGLRRIRVDVWRGTNRVPVAALATNPAPDRTTAAVAGVLDLAAMGAKIGETLRYSACVEDVSGQTNRSPEYVVRMADDQDAADRRLTRFAGEEDQFARRLAELVEAQSNVTTALRQMEAKYGAVADRARSNVTAALQAAALAGASQDVARLAASTVDPETAKTLEQLRQRMADAASRQQQTQQAASQVLTNFMQAAARAQNLPLLPSDWSGQMQAAAQAWDRSVASPMARLSQTLGAAAQPGAVPPALPAAANDSERLQRDIGRMGDEVQGMTDAAHAALTNAWAALDAMRAETVRAQATAAERDLADLSLLMETMNGQLRNFEGTETGLLAETQAQGLTNLAPLAGSQQMVEAQSDATLRDASLLQGHEDLWAQRPAPYFPAAPYTPEGQPYAVPPKEQDTAPTGEMARTGPRTAADGQPNEDQPLFMPALGGPPPTLDPRYADAYRPAAPGPAQPGDPTPQQQELARREYGRLTELDLARQAVGADQHAVNDMLQQLQQGWQGTPAGLVSMLQSAAMQQAMAMAQRSGGMQSQALMPAMGGMSQLPQGLRLFGVAADDPIMGQLDPRMRTLLLRMQPVQREEILQGLREEGPPSYRSLIRNYFRQLTELQDGGHP